MVRGALVVGVTAWVACMAFERTASACSYALACDRFALAPKSGLTLPATAPAVAVDKTLGMPAGSTLTAKVEGVGGGDVLSQVEATADGWLVRLLDPLTPGTTYRVSVSASCEGADDPAMATATATTEVLAVPASPLPTSAGSVSAAHRFTDEMFPRHIVKLTITPSPALVPYLPVTRFRTVVDGKEYALSAHGAPLDVWLEGNGWPTTFNQLEAYCSGSIGHETCYGTQTTTPRPHEVEVYAEIAGAPPLPPITANIDMSCPSIGDAGAPDGSLGAANGGHADAGAGGAAQNGASAPLGGEAGGGCSAAPSAPTRATPILALGFAFASAVVAFARRRRRAQ